MYKRVIIIFTLLVIRLNFATDYVYTKSAVLLKEGTGIIGSSLSKYIYYNMYGRTEREYLVIPMQFNYGLTTWVQISMNAPLIKTRDALNDPLAINNGGGEPMIFGDFDLELRFGGEDAEYDFFWAFIFKFQFDSGQPINLGTKDEITIDTNKEATFDKVTDFDQLTRDSGITRSVNLSYYPFSTGEKNFSLGYYTSFLLLRSVFLNFNFIYTYEFSYVIDQETGKLRRETLRDFFKFESGLVKQTDDAGKEIEKFKLNSLFGVEKMLKRLFWVNSKSDPWADKENDHLDINLSLDTFLDTDYYIFNKRIIIGLKPFIEFAGLINWEPTSSYRSHLIVNPGIWLKMTEYIRFLFGYTQVLQNKPDYPLEAGVISGVRIKF